MVQELFGKTILDILRRFRWKIDDLMENERRKRRPQVPTSTKRLSYANATETKSKVCTENFPEFFRALESLYQAFKKFSISQYK